MAVWEQVLMGMGAFLILFLFWPGAKQAMQRSKQVENPEWQAALLPIGIVVLFVVLLILLAKS